MTIQLRREYPDKTWESTKKNTHKLQGIKEEIRPVKIM
jgi:hypothetical protein